jgi:hypothetical protein
MHICPFPFSCLLFMLLFLGFRVILTVLSAKFCFIVLFFYWFIYNCAFIILVCFDCFVVQLVLFACFTFFFHMLFNCSFNLALLAFGKMEMCALEKRLLLNLLLLIFLFCLESNNDS